MPDSRKFFTGDQSRAIEEAIRRSERNTSGEIRVHIESKCNSGVMACAVRAFRKMRMHKTKYRNGVLIYLALQNREFAIFGDEGINKVVPVNFWDETKEKMEALFREGKFAEGICVGIESAGEQLKKYFPLSDSDANELPDEVTFGPHS
jgi:uncharacterized membrane protein